MHGLKWSDLWDWVGGGHWVELPADASGACAAARSPWLTPPHYQDLPYIYFESNLVFVSWASTNIIQLQEFSCDNAMF